MISFSLLSSRVVIYLFIFYLFIDWLIYLFIYLCNASYIEEWKLLFRWVRLKVLYSSCTGNIPN